MSMLKRSGFGASVVLLSMGLLTSCLENSPQGAVEISVAEGELQIANCGDEIRAPFDVFVSEIDYPDTWTVLDGDSVPVDWATGGMRSTAADGWGAVRERGDAEVSPGHQINVFLQNDEGSSRSSFIVPAGGLKAGMWLRPDGTVTDSPCDQ